MIMIDDYMTDDYDWWLWLMIMTDDYDRYCDWRLWLMIVIDDYDWWFMIMIYDGVQPSIPIPIPIPIPTPATHPVHAAAIL